MIPNALLGVILHAIGGFAAGSFYAPLKAVRNWAWESFWMVMGVAAWIITPWIVALITTPELLLVLTGSPPKTMAWTFMFGLLWGIGGLTFGLTMRYLGIALGMAVALGFCMTFGTLIPPLFDGKMGEIVGSMSGLIILLGVATCLAGIALCGWAGVCKEAELTKEQQKDAIAEFALGKGFAVATVSGILSACFAFALAAGEPIAAEALDHGAKSLFKNNAVLVVILLGGFTTNAIWCLVLNTWNRSFGDYVNGPTGRQLVNYFLSALSGVIWYGQFFFYGMGTTKLGEKYGFSSWSIHMAFIIVFSNLWGIVFHEWRGTSSRTKLRVWFGILTLIVSTMVIGFGNYLAE